MPQRAVESSLQQEGQVWTEGVPVAIEVSPAPLSLGESLGVQEAAVPAPAPELGL